MTKHCQSCGKEVSGRGHNARYCTRECRLEFYGKPVTPTRKCMHCGNEFRNTTNIKKYCTKKCYADHQAAVKLANITSKEAVENNNPKFAASSWRLYTDIPDCNIKWRKTKSFRRMDYTALTHCYEVVFEFVDHTRTDEMEHDGKELQEADLLIYFELVVNNERDRLTPAQFAERQF